MIYGYCRISTPQQSLDRQIRNINKLYPSALIVKHITNTKHSVKVCNFCTIKRTHYLVNDVLQVKQLTKPTECTITEYWPDHNVEYKETFETVEDAIDFIRKIWTKWSFINKNNNDLEIIAKNEFYLCL